MSFYCIRVVVPIFVWGGAALTGGGQIHGSYIISSEAIVLNVSTSLKLPSISLL